MPAIRTAPAPDWRVRLRAWARRWPRAAGGPATITLLALVLLAPVSGFATTAGQDDGALQGFDHAAWGLERGAPGDIWDIAQAADGRLWMATGAGLYTFDGQHFARQPAPAGQAFASNNMTTLLLTADGTLWIAYYNAGISRLAHGVLTHYRPGRDVPEGLVPRMTVDADGRLWAASEGGLRWFDGQRWQPPEATLRYPGSGADWVLCDRHGTLWVSTGHALVLLPRGATAFVSAQQPVAGFATLAEGPHGEIWLADRARGLIQVSDGDRLLTPRERSARTLPTLRANRIRVLRDGSLWGSALHGGGAFRVSFDGPHGTPKVQHVDAAQGLTSTVAAPLLEDREANLWVGTNQGLNRFHANAVHALTPPAGSAPPLRALAQADDGTVYAYRVELQPQRLDRAALRMAASSPSAMPAPSLLLAEENRLAWWRDGRLQPFLPDGYRPSHQLHAAAYRGGQAWLCNGSRQVLHFDGARWRGADELPRQACSTLAIAADGRVAFGFPDGSVIVRERQRLRRYGRDQGLDVGPVTTLQLDADGLLVAGEAGLALRGSDDRFHPVQPPATTPGLLDSINGIARDSHGQLWLYGMHGLLRADAGDLLRSAQRQLPLQALRQFDAADGVPGLSLQMSTSPTLALGADGLLWLSSNHGLAWLDTDHLPRNPVAPQVRIGEVAFGDQHLPLRDGLRLPKGSSQLQIDYAATSLARPDRLRYRYRLLGLEDAWHDAGELTRASYVNLGPGHYRFEVMAANEDGVWSPTAAAAGFDIAPAFVQTAAFKVLCVALLLALLALAVRLRSRQLAARVRARMEERHDERERIARELHDTLLQGTQGLILRLHATSQRLRTDDPVRGELETAMDLAEQAVAQGRERVRGLRHSALGPHELGAALLQLRPEPHAHAPDLRLLLEGEPRPLLPCTGEELLLIGREALFNAFRHAQADAVEIEVSYGDAALCLRIRDDGRGIDDQAQARPGHFGLRGMHERAARIGARLQVWSRPDAGTEIQIAVPADRAYLHPPRRRRWLRVPFPPLSTGDA
jgi:signal transduction histidine kinase/ligand-binding sensor domain-containing protein